MTNSEWLQKAVDRVCQEIGDDNDPGFRVMSYSGRGMYGKRCIGLKIDNVSDLPDVLKSIKSMVKGSPKGMTVKSATFDSLGMRVAAYWSKLEV